MPAKLPTRKIGQDDVTAIGFGLMGLSAFYSSVDTRGSDEERFRVLDQAIEEGCTFWDSADVYGDSEDLVGKWFKRTGKRDEVFLATKFGITPNGANGTPEYVRASAEKSLKRLGIETIDLYYLHRADINTPIEKTVGAMAELVKEGKVRYIGLSEISATTLRRAHAVHPISAVQVEYSPFFLDIENEKVALLKTCRELGIAVIAYSPLGRGLLTGAYKSPKDFEEGDWRKTVPRFSEENFPNILKITEGLKQLGAKYDANSWADRTRVASCPRRRYYTYSGYKEDQGMYLQENLGALKVRLSEEDVTEVRRIAAAADAAQGERYPASSMSLIWVDTPEL